MTKTITEFGSDGEKYVKRPIEIDAKQIPFAFQVETLEGLMQGKAMDYLIKGIKGELYPCDQEIFKATYKKVIPEE